LVFKQQTSLKASNAFFKLDEKLKNKQMTIYQVLDAYGCSEKKYVDLSDFCRLIKVIDSSFSNEELRYSFSLIDKKGIGKIPCE
jgi:Ca2+-binding EF-hand superfamily protein